MTIILDKSLNLGVYIMKKETIQRESDFQYFEGIR